ncbi:MAG: gliding motility-associated-like protein [Bacteroidia bacterium]
MKTISLTYKLGLSASFFAFLVMGFASEVRAQCSIQSNDYVCLNEPLSLTAQASAGVGSAAWNFGDANTSSITNPFHIYASAGTFTVTAVITLSTGGTCTATKSIDVYKPPSMDLSKSASNKYCLTENDVCIVDNSTSGNSGVNNTKRTILWGDGNKTDANNPQTGSKECYKYGKEGNYTLTIEIVNDKGCKAKQELKLNVLFDFYPSFKHYKQSVVCDSQIQCFYTDIAWHKYASDITSIHYDFADGSTYQLNKGTLSDTICHAFKNSGNYAVNAIVTLKNGCTVRYQKNVNIILQKVNVNIINFDSVLCYPNYHEFTHSFVSGQNVDYSWTAYDTAYKPLYNFGSSRNAFYFPETPGKFYVELRITNGGCVSFGRDSIESIGVKAGALILNGSQCSPQDTVYFCDRSIAHRTGTLEYFWNFIDKRAAACTTSTAKGISVNKNCNFSEDKDTKHYYVEEKCSEIWHKVRDTRTGCSDSAKWNVVIGKPDLSEVNIVTNKLCAGNQSEYAIFFEFESCFGNVEINVDSACGKDKWIDIVGAHRYSKTCDTAGWVTIGFNAKTGDNRIYRSCDTTDYYIDDRKICRDTLWLHHEFRLDKAPLPAVIPSYSGCIPTTMKGEFAIPVQTNVRKIYLNWADGGYDSILVPPGTDSLPNFEHLYTRSGIYNPLIILETDSGCQEDFRWEHKVGYYNEFDFFDQICPNQKVGFNDTITYWDDTTQYWRKPSNPERIQWHYGDGSAFDTLTQPNHAFTKPGVYQVKMVSFTKIGCSDTVTKDVHVLDVFAGIKVVDKKIICDDILQLFDSSRAMNDPRDSLTYYFWDFGDGKTPSYLENPFHYYSSFGTFTVKHIIENTIGCKDTATIDVIINGPEPNFDIISDTVGCVPFTAHFDNTSKKSTDYIWYFGDALSPSNTLSTKLDTNVSFTYNRPGTYYIYLYAGDSIVNPDNNNQVYYCSATFPDSNALNPPVRRIVVLPIPVVDFNLDGKLCFNSEVNLIDQSDSIYNYFRWYWNPDSTVSPSPSQTMILTDTGTISITYRPTYIPSGPYQRACYDTIIKEFEVIRSKAEMSFTKNPDCPTYTFNAIGDSTDLFLWDFGHPSSGSNNFSLQRTVSHSFYPNEGEFTVCLTSETESGCIDSVCVKVQNDYRFELFIPNVLTPNNDQLNDVYEISIEGEDYYDLKIFNRWGEVVYKAGIDYDENSSYNWDGTAIGNGVLCPGGTYFYIFTFREQCSTERKLEKYYGSVTLIRD